MEIKSFVIPDVVDETVDLPEIELVHAGGGDDGYPTYVKIDGKTSPDMWPTDNGKREVKITLAAIAGEPFCIYVEWQNKKVTIYRPREFNFTLGDLHIEIHPDRYPCLISLGGYEPRLPQMVAVFEEGKMVLFHMAIKPHVASGD